MCSALRNGVAVTAKAKALQTYCTGNGFFFQNTTVKSFFLKPRIVLKQRVLFLRYRCYAFFF